MELTFSSQVNGGAIPVPYLVLDLETCDPTEQEIELEAAFLKASGNCLTDEARDRSLKKKIDSLQEKAALTDLAPIACIAVKTPEKPSVFSQFPLNPEEHAAFTAQGIDYYSAPDEKTLLMRFRDFLASQTDEFTTLVGYNILGFDVRKLRFRYLFHRLKIPGFLQPGGSVVDLMAIVNNHLTIKHEWLSLDEILQKLHVAGGKLLDGSEVPALLAAGEYARVLAYCIHDTLLCEQLYALIAGTIGA
jgi:hypothetical protein